MQRQFHAMPYSSLSFRMLCVSFCIPAGEEACCFVDAISLYDECNDIGEVSQCRTLVVCIKDFFSKGLVSYA